MAWTPLHKYVSNRIISPRGEMKDLRNHHTVMFEIVRTCRRNSSTHHDPRRKNLAQSETYSVPVAYIMHRLYQDDKTSIGHCVAEGFQANIRAACLCSRAASQAFRTFNCFPSFIPSTSCFRSAWGGYKEVKTNQTRSTMHKHAHSHTGFHLLFHKI